MYVSIVSFGGGSARDLNCVFLSFQPGPSCVVPGCSSAGTGDVSVGTRSVMGNMIAGMRQTREIVVCF